MSSESRVIARRHPLRVRAIGVAGGRTLVARGNWDIVEVRDLEGALRMRHQVALEGELLMHSFAFMADRYLVVELGAGAMAEGYRAWDFIDERWCAGALEHWDDVSLVGVDTVRGRVALSDGDGVDVVDVPGDRVASRFAIFSPATVAFHPTRTDVVAASGDSYLLAEKDTDDDVLALFSEQRFPRIRRTPPCPASDGPILAWIDEDTLARVTGSGEVVSLNHELDPIRTLGVVRSPVHGLRTSHGRWVAVHAGEETFVFDTRGGPARTLRGVAYVEPDGMALAWATDDDAGQERLD